MITHKIRITGKVQGVFFRESMRQEALKHQVNGWVRNRKDGSVEAVVQGEQEAVDKVLSWCRHGPPNAKVENIEIDYVEEDIVFAKFERRESMD